MWWAIYRLVLFSTNVPTISVLEKEKYLLSQVVYICGYSSKLMKIKVVYTTVMHRFQLLTDKFGEQIEFWLIRSLQFQIRISNQPTSKSQNLNCSTEFYFHLQNHRLGHQSDGADKHTKCSLKTFPVLWGFRICA